MTTQIPELETERLILRALKAEDFDALAAFYDSERSKFVGGPLSAEMAWRHMACELGHWSLRGYGRWAVTLKSTQDFVGVVGLWNPLGWPEPELGWDLMEGFEGQGYAHEAALAARAYAYDVLGWSTVISLIAEANTRSAALAARMGAVLEGPFLHERHGSMNIWRHPAPEKAER